MIGLSARKNKHIGKKHIVSLGPKGDFEINRPGALHRALGVPEDTTIGKPRILEATHSTDPDIRSMAV